MAENTEKGWSPYIAGALAGLTLSGSIWTMGKFFGSSTAFVRTAGMLEKSFDSDSACKNSYYQLYEPKIDWQWMFVGGISLGAFVSSILSRTFRLQGVPDMWQARFGPSKIKRGMAAFIGGILTIFGARISGGCPSGHGLTGISQLSVNSLTALTSFFIGGLVMARKLYGGDK